MGDDAHLVSPFAGKGENVAMADGMDIASALVDVCKGGGLVGEVGVFDKDSPRTFMATMAKMIEERMAGGGPAGPP